MKKPPAQPRSWQSARARATYTQSEAADIKGDPRDREFSINLVGLVCMTEAEIWDFERYPICFVRMDVWAPNIFNLMEASRSTAAHLINAST
eukprot:3965717-Pyramimonas_sp.AAC.1